MNMLLMGVIISACVIIVGIVLTTLYIRRLRKSNKK